MQPHAKRPVRLPASYFAAILLTTFLPAAHAAAEEVTVEIKLKAGTFVLVPGEKQIKAGQSIKWVPVDLPTVTHHLKGETPEDSFEETGDFNSSNPPTQSFSEVGEIKYFCTKHPKTMRGRIVVAPSGQ